MSGTFLAQTRYYSAQTLDVSAHDNARIATDRLAGEIRSSMEDGFVVAGPRTMTIRSAIRLASVCETGSTRWTVYFDDGPTGLDAAEVAGAALRDPATGTWEYQNATWASLDDGFNDAAIDCALAGPADTVGASGDFNRLALGSLFATTPAIGDIVMLFRETTFKIQMSSLDTLTFGLYRQPYGGTLVEFATGMDSTAQFQYRTGGSTYADTIVGSAVSDIDAVRIVADARLPAPSAMQEDATFGWSVNISVRNLP